MIFLVFTVFGHSLAQWSENNPRKRGPQGVSEWDRDHVYNPEGWRKWPWLSYSSSYQSDVDSSRLILFYYYGGMGWLEPYGKFLSLKNLTNSNFSQLIRQIWPPMTNCMPGCIESPMRSYTIWKKAQSGGFTKVVMGQHAGPTVAGWRLINGLIINCRRHRRRHR